MLAARPSRRSRSQAIYAAGRRTPYPLEAKPATHRARHKDIVFENSGQRGNGAPAGAVPGNNLLQPEGLKIIDGFRNDRFGT
jgi:hypothetical protein